MKLRNKVVLITGISGTAGDKIAARCLQEGAEVKGLIRNKEKMDLCSQLGITPVIGDLTDKDTILKALQNVDIIIHAAAYLGEDRAIAEASNIEGVQNLVDGAIAAGVERFVHISTLSVYGHFDGAVELDEESDLAYGHSEVYISTKCESERIIQAAIAKGLEGVILRPGVICSESNSHWGDKLIARLAHTEDVNWIHPDDLTPWVHAENLAEMCVLAATHPAAVNQCYNAVDGNYPEQEFTVRIGRAMNKKFTTPGGDPIRMAYSYTKIKDELGYSPVIGFEETMIQLEKQARGDSDV
ncbi:NAD(P)-dependent oxidoreductase [Paenibacillus tritici]|uniref:NAD-dependent epimerase/dehydratase family protein n=1 Tax=Paenibacillus tritici TaxID=1873425 RepID=UPI001BA8F236|nr:NAD(P)-dependent oxidoreductase [Paenibacillus tritici]QUL54914.1 NAD(P)-dependent oxidoreductase [Paenibacillus tritici]